MFGTRHHSHTPGRSNLAGRMGRWSAAHWKTATFGWLAMVVVAFGLGGMVGMKTIDADTPGPGESGRVDRILDAGFKQPAGESVLIQSSTLRAGDPEFSAAVRDVVAGISKLGIVQQVRSPLAPVNRGQIAPNGHAALVELQIRGDPDTAVDRIGPVLDRVAALQKAHPQLFIGEFGDASKVDALVTAYGNDLGKAGLLSLPVTLIILLVAFGALVAAGIPLLLFVILFGLSMDYHVLVLSRIRELYDSGESMDDAISNGIKRTAGVVTSAAVVMVFVFSIFAALSMLFFKQFGVGLAVAILIDATIVRAVLLPATMKLLGDWNWYLPRWLQWLPRLEAGEPEPAKEAAPAATSA